jgi:hypothetical protein
MSWYNTGYDATETAWDDVPYDSDAKDKRFFVPYPGGTKNTPVEDCTKRILVLDDDPASFWEHQFKFRGNFKHREVCWKRNKQLAAQGGGECPPCERISDKYPYYVGLHTIIDMTPWFTKKGNVEMNFQRRIFAAKLGGKDKPGVLVKLRKLRAKHGRLRGLIFDVERPGKKTEVCGSEFDLVQKLDSDQIETYCMEQMQEYVKRRNAKLADDKQVDVAKLLEWNPWEPYDWGEEAKPTPLADLRKMFGKDGGYEVDSYSGGGGGGSSKSSSNDGDGKSDMVDDDIPY